MRLEINVKLQDDFYINEFLHSDDRYYPNDQHKINLYQLAEKAQIARNIFRQSMRVTSGYRSKEYNKKVKGDYDSYHMDGLAMDFELLNDKRIEDYSNWSPTAIFNVLNFAGFHNVGLSVRKGTKNIQWIHADIGVQR